MQSPAHREEDLDYVVSFRLPGSIRPISRVGVLRIHADGTGVIFIRDAAGLLAPCDLPLTAADVVVCRKVIGFWMAPIGHRLAMVS